MAAPQLLELLVKVRILARQPSCFAQSFSFLSFVEIANAEIGPEAALSGATRRSVLAGEEPEK